MCAKKMWNSKVKQPNQKSLKSTYCDAYSNADFLAEMGTLSGGVTRPVWSRAELGPGFVILKLGVGVKPGVNYPENNPNPRK